MHNELDHNHKSTKDNLKLRTATQNKEEFMNSFSIKFELPTMHILQKKIMELAPGYSVEIAKYLYPQNNKILSYCNKRKEPKPTTYQKY